MAKLCLFVTKSTIEVIITANKYIVVAIIVILCDSPYSVKTVPWFIMPSGEIIIAIENTKRDKKIIFFNFFSVSFFRFKMIIL